METITAGVTLGDCSVDKNDIRCMVHVQRPDFWRFVIVYRTFLVCLMHTPTACALNSGCEPLAKILTANRLLYISRLALGSRFSSGVQPSF